VGFLLQNSQPLDIVNIICMHSEGGGRRNGFTDGSTAGHFGRQKFWIRRVLIS